MKQIKKTGVLLIVFSLLMSGGGMQNVIASEIGTGTEQVTEILGEEISEEAGSNEEKESTEENIPDEGNIPKEEDTSTGEVPGGEDADKEDGTDKEDDTDKDIADEENDYKQENPDGNEEPAEEPVDGKDDSDKEDAGAVPALKGEMIDIPVLEEITVEDDEMLLLPQEYYVLGRRMTEEEEREQYALMQRMNNSYIPAEGEAVAPSVMDDPDFYMSYSARVSDRKYDPRTTLTSVKDQNPYGTCWTFATMNMLESSLIRNNGFSNSNVDLAERHLTYFGYFTQPDPLGGTANDTISLSYNYNNLLNAGGNIGCGLRILANWMGAVDESDAPYGGLPSPLDNSMAYNRDKIYVTDFYEINKGDTQVIKQNILDCGAVGMSYCSDSAVGSTRYYNANTAAYYCDETYIANHAVSIVGWDDDFPKEAFITTPEGNGAWIVKNSWDSNWGDGGYFYLSYYDKTIDTTMYAVRAVTSDKYDNNYQYDMSYFTGTASINSSSIGAANIFRAKANSSGSENIEAVSFECRTTMTDYSIQIYKNLVDLSDPTSGNAVFSSELTGKTTCVGYYTVDLPKEINVREGEYFSVVITFSKPGGVVSIPLEGNGSLGGFASCRPSGAPGQSFYSSGSGIWKDMYDVFGENIRIKAFTNNAAGSVNIPVDEISLSDSSIVLDTVGNTYQIDAVLKPADATDLAIDWKVSDDSVIRIEKIGPAAGKTASVKVTAVGPGTAMLTAVPEGNRGIKASVRITVNSNNANYVRAFVCRMYTCVLNRMPEPEGLRNWSNYLLDKRTDGAGVAEGFILSDEFKRRNVSNEEYLEILYKTFFNRQPDSQGKADWLYRLNNGMSRRYVLLGFVNSAEFQTICSSYGINRGTMTSLYYMDKNEGVTMFVNRLYVTALQRMGEEQGMEEWAERLLNHTMSPEDVAKCFFLSSEFVNKNHSDRKYVELLYGTFLDRQPDPAGMETWLRELQNGKSRESVLEGFSRSAEFRDIMSKYGL